MQGDGYTIAIACEFADESQTDGVEPDANPIYCKPSDDDTRETSHS